MLTAYGILRLVHGAFRWVVLAAGLALLVRTFRGARAGSAFTAADERAAQLFLGALDLQLLLGLTLYFGFSPFFPAVRSAFGAAMHDPVTRFFGAEHGTAMLLAVFAAHAGRVRARRLPDGPARHRALRAALLVFFALVLWAIPWPWRTVGRPLLRLSP